MRMQIAVDADDAAQAELTCIYVFILCVRFGNNVPYYEGLFATIVNERKSKLETSSSPVGGGRSNNVHPKLENAFETRIIIIICSTTICVFCVLCIELHIKYLRLSHILSKTARANPQSRFYSMGSGSGQHQHYSANGMMVYNPGAICNAFALCVCVCVSAS